MAVSISAMFKLVDQMSSGMNRIGTTGEAALRKIESSANRAEQAFSRCQGSTNRLSSIYKNFEGNTEQLASAVQRGEKMLSSMEQTEGETAATTFEYSTKLEAANQAQDRLANAMSNADKAAENYEETMRGISVTEEDVREAQEELATATRELFDAFDKGAEAALDLEEASEIATQGMEKFGDKSTNAIQSVEQLLVAAGITKLISEITEALLDCAAAAETIETSAAKLETLAGSQYMSMLSDQIYTISAATGEAQEGLYEVAYNAISVGTDIKRAAEITEAATKLATAGFTDSSSALSVLTTATNSYGKAAGSATDITDGLITVQNLGVTTVGELASSMGKSISTAAAYNVSLNNLESAYISVTKAGISTQEGTTYINAMITELGKSSSDVAKILREETGQSFGELMTSGYSLADVLEILYNRAGQNSEAMMNLWGSQTAAVASAAIVNQGLETFNSNLETLKNSSGATAKAYSIMADTTEYAHNKMENSAKNLQIAIGNQLNPVMEKLYNLAANVLGGMTAFVNEHPWIVKAITSITVAATIFIGAITAYTVATKLATVAQTAFNAVMDANPFFLVTSAIVALTAGLVGYILATGEATEYSDELCFTSRQQAEELEKLKTQYDEICDTLGESSDQAYDLQYKIEYLSDRFESSKQTVGEYIQGIKDLNQSWKDSLDSSREAYEQVDISERKALALVRQLERLASQQDITTESEMEMKTIIQELNKELPTLNLNYEDIIKNADSFASSVESIVKAKAATQRYEAAMTGAAEAQSVLLDAEPKLAELKGTQTELTNEVERLESAYKAAQSTYNSWVNQGGKGQYGLLLKSEMESAKTAFETANQELTKLNGQIEEIQSTVDGAQGDYDNYIAKLTEMADAADNAFANAQTQEDLLYAMAQAVSDLSDEYDEAYNAALTSFSGQFDLFDEAQASMDATVANAQAALDSQLAYWKNYLDNVNVLKETSASDLGITQENYNALMAYVQDGSEEAAGLAQSMVSAINSGDEEAVADLANTLAEVQSKQEEAASAVAEWQIDFNSKMDEIVQKAETTVQNMDLCSEASAAAAATINAYADAIEAKGGRAIAAAQSIASHVQAALLSTNVSVPSISGYAIGTEYASPGVHLVGENGPELMLFRGGEEIIPNDESEDILARSLSDSQDNIPESLMPIPSMTYSESDNVKESKRTVDVNINGQGSITIDRSMSKDEIVDIVYEYVKPAVISVIENEIIEEGDDSYDY